MAEIEYFLPTLGKRASSFKDNNSSKSRPRESNKEKEKEAKKGGCVADELMFTIESFAAKTKLLRDLIKALNQEK